MLCGHGFAKFCVHRATTDSLHFQNASATPVLATVADQYRVAVGFNSVTVVHKTSRVFSRWGRALSSPLQTCILQVHYSMHSPLNWLYNLLTYRNNY